MTERKMKLINGHPACVLGRNMYSESTLKSMSKTDLIELLHIAQHNYEALLESYCNVQKYAERLQKENRNLKLRCGTLELHAPKYVY